MIVYIQLHQDIQPTITLQAIDIGCQDIMITTTPSYSYYSSLYTDSLYTRSYYSPYYWRNYYAYPYLYYSPYLSRYTPIRSLSYYDSIYRRPSTYWYYYTSPSWTPYYSLSAYRSYLLDKELSLASIYRRRFYDDYFISYSGYSRYLLDKYETDRIIARNANKS